MRNLGDIHQCRDLTLLGIDHRNLVGLVRRRHEVTMGRIPTTVVQETRGFQRGHSEGIQIAVVHQQYLAGFLHVHDELGVLVRGHNSRHPWFRMVFLCIHGHAPSGHDLFRLQGGTIHQHVLRGPVGTGNRNLVLVALVLGRLH